MKIIEDLNALEKIVKTRTLKCHKKNKRWVKKFKEKHSKVYYKPACYQCGDTFVVHPEIARQYREEMKEKYNENSDNLLFGCSSDAVSIPIPTMRDKTNFNSDILKWPKGGFEMKTSDITFENVYKTFSSFSTIVENPFYEIDRGAV